MLLKLYLLAGGLDLSTPITLLAADRPSVAARDFSIGHLTAMRKLLGAWGLTPSDVVYVVSTDAYYDLLEDPDFRTVDLVGDRATILTGQIGSANGSPVVVSSVLGATASGNPAAMCVNKSNFVVGNRRFLLMEQDRDVQNQKNWLVATRRMAFKDLIAGYGVSVAYWKA